LAFFPIQPFLGSDLLGQLIKLVFKNLFPFKQCIKIFIANSKFAAAPDKNMTSKIEKNLSMQKVSKIHFNHYYISTYSGFFRFWMSYTLFLSDGTTKNWIYVHFRFGNIVFIFSNCNWAAINLAIIVVYNAYCLTFV
jgi:hypothetical protein